MEDWRKHSLKNNDQNNRDEDISLNIISIYNMPRAFVSFVCNVWSFLLYKSYLPCTGDARWQCLCYDNGERFKNVYGAER